MNERLVELTGRRPERRGCRRCARDWARVSLSSEALWRMRQARDVVDAILATDEAVYGLNTGLGSFARYRIPPDQLGPLLLRHSGGPELLPTAGHCRATSCGR